MAVDHEGPRYDRALVAGGVDRLDREAVGTVRQGRGRKRRSAGLERVRVDVALVGRPGIRWVGRVELELRGGVVDDAALRWGRRRDEVRHGRGGVRRKALEWG